MTLSNKSIIAFILAIFCLNAFGHGTVTLGTGTTHNTHTDYPAPYGTYKKRIMVRSDCRNGSIRQWAAPYTLSTMNTLLSGTYTINSTEPTGGTNFNSFTDLANALTTGGFDGPVTVNVVAGTGPYTESFVLNELNYNNATNTLTINGNGETLQYLSTDNYQRATLKLNGTDYVTVNNLIIKALGTASNEYGFAVHIKSGADHNAFNNCQFITNRVGCPTS